MRYCLHCDFSEYITKKRDSPSKSLRNEWKRDLEGLQSSGLHGISSIVNASNNWSRLWWGFILLTFFVFAVMHT